MRSRFSRASALFACGLTLMLLVSSSGVQAQQGKTQNQATPQNWYMDHELKSYERVSAPETELKSYESEKDEPEVKSYERVSAPETELKSYESDKDKPELKSYERESAPETELKSYEDDDDQPELKSYDDD